MFAAVLLSVCKGAPACAAQLPNATDLKATYCIAVTKARVSVLRGAMAELTSNSDPRLRDFADERQEDLREAEDLLNRLQLYLAPRVAYLDPTSLLAASRRGEIDIAAFVPRWDTVFGKCAADCKLIGSSGAQYESAVKCTAACTTQDDLLVRVRSYATETFLPF